MYLFMIDQKLHLFYDETARNFWMIQWQKIQDLINQCCQYYLFQVKRDIRVSKQFWIFSVLSVFNLISSSFFNLFDFHQNIYLNIVTCCFFSSSFGYKIYCNVTIQVIFVHISTHQHKSTFDHAHSIEWVYYLFIPYVYIHMRCVTSWDSS